MSVGRLFFAARPFAVPGLVPEIVLNPVDAKSSRRFAHVFHKELKLHPAITHLNPPAPISVPIAVIYILAPLNHSLPNGVDFGVTHSMPKTAPSLEEHDPPTAARSPSTILKFAVCDNHNLSARTPAKTMSPAVPGRRSGEHKKISKSQSGERSWNTHDIVRFNVVLAVGDRLQPALTAIINKSMINSSVTISLIK